MLTGFKTQIHKEPALIMAALVKDVMGRRGSAGQRVSEFI
jgi:hypothetical protein